MINSVNAGRMNTESINIRIKKENQFKVELEGNEENDMQIKKKACVAIASCAAVLLTGFSAFAQITDVSYEMKYGVITISGKTDVFRKGVTYKAYKSNSDKVLSISQPEVQNDGSFVFKTGFKTSGDYMIQIKDSSGASFETEICGYISIDDARKQFLDTINEGSDADIKMALDEINFRFEGDEWLEISDEDLKAWILKYIEEHRTYEAFDEIETEYAQLNALYRINKAKISSIASELEEYAEILGIGDNKDVKAFISGAKNAQKKELVRELDDNPATTAEALREAVEKANNVKASDNSSGGGSSGKGSSSGNGVIKIEPSIIKPDAENKSEAKTEAFSDLAHAEWAKESIEALVSKGVISGYGDGTFKPNANVTREEFVKMVVIAFDIPYEGKECAFLDVFENDWFRPYVGAAREYGIVNGIADDIFGIRKEITRQDAAVILKRTADYVSLNINTIRTYEGFLDNSNISDYAKEAVRALYCGGIINGRGNGLFVPTDTCTRAEAVKMIYGIIKGD